MIVWFNFHPALKYHIKWKQVEAAIYSWEACGKMAEAETA